MTPSWLVTGDLPKLLNATAETWASEAWERIVFLNLFILPMLYGSVHLSAWAFEFPTPVEGLLWKAASIAVATAMFFWFLLVLVIAMIFSWLDIEDEILDFVIFGIVGRITMFMMIICRVYIVVEAFVSLRAVPIGVYWTPAWIQMIPHV